MVGAASGAGTYGVYGQATTYGVYGSGAVGVQGSGGTWGVYASGNLGASGTKSAVVALPDNRVVTLYAVESPEVWFEDFGTVELHSGLAQVALDAAFQQTVNTEAGYHVFLTPGGDCEGLYVAQKSTGGFLIREARGGKSNISVDYRIVARRRGFEAVRLQEVDADEETVETIRSGNHAKTDKPIMRAARKFEGDQAPKSLPSTQSQATE